MTRPAHTPPVSLDNALQAWGDALPDWVRILAEECDRTSQPKAGRRIGYSRTAVNQVLRNTYRRSLDRIEHAVRGALMNEKVECPILGALTIDKCQQNQNTPFQPTNHMRVRLYKACRSGCQHSRIGERND